MMYDFLSHISGWLSQPFSNVAHSTDIAIISALFLGFIGSVAPCQISANLGAITYFGNRGIKQNVPWVEMILYLLGKVFVFSVLGLLFWFFGKSISNESIPLFVYARKLLGPILIVIGLFLMGWIKLPGEIGFRLANRLSEWSRKIDGKGGAFLMGAAFSLGFCPTMFWLYFGLLMPIVLESSSGVFLPPVFAVGTAMPLLLFFSLYIGFGLDQVIMKRAKSWGGWIQKAAGIFFVLLGISDTFTYWTL
jgi:cytochrome c-type biogenesis protein